MRSLCLAAVLLVTFAGLSRAEPIFGNLFGGDSEVEDISDYDDDQGEGRIFFTSNGQCLYCLVDRVNISFG